MKSFVFWKGLLCMRACIRVYFQPFVLIIHKTTSMKMMGVENILMSNYESQLGGLFMIFYPCRGECYIEGELYLNFFK